MKNKLHTSICAIFIALFCVAFCPSAYALTDPNIAATSAILYDSENGMVLYDKDADIKSYPASTTKVMTALIVLDNVTDLDQLVTVTEEDFYDVSWDSSKAGFLVGEEISVLDLLYGMLLPSGNEAANTLARFVGGDIETFTTMMNERAKDLGCTSTNFVNPNGLHDDNHYTTARDMSLIATEAMKDETFALIVNTAQKTLSETNMTEERGYVLKVYTTNMLIYSKSDPNFYSNAKGIKTGFTTPAGACLVATAIKGDTTLISVVFGAEKTTDGSQSFPETKKLFEWGFENFESKVLVGKGETIGQVDVALSTEVDKIVPQVSDSITAIVPIDIDMDDLVLVKNLPDEIRAPISTGDILGTLEVYYDDTFYGKVNLVAMSDVERSDVLYYADQLNNFFKSDLFKKIIIVIAGLLILYVVILIIIGRLRRYRRRRSIRESRKRYRK